MQTSFCFDQGLVKIVKNCWAEAYHVQDLRGFTVASREQPHVFPSAERAREWALLHGFEIYNRGHSEKE